MKITDVNKKLKLHDKNIDDINLQIEALSYIPISILSHTISPSIVEKGNVINSVEIKWKYNKDIVSQSLNNISLNKNTREYSFNQSVLGDVSFVIEYSDEKTSKTSTKNLVFSDAIYYGTSTSILYDDDFILSLSKIISSNRNQTWSVEALNKEYIYFALPESYGIPTFIVEGFEGGFSLAKSLLFTNKYGHAEQYSLYKSDNHSLGKITIESK